jgi:hypothetical protein
VSLRFITDVRGQPLGEARNDRFGPIIYDKVEVEERIRRAQRAILNPSTEFRHFLQGKDEDPEQRQLTFSTNCVSLQISGREVADLSFVDLPGRPSARPPINCADKWILQVSLRALAKAAMLAT